MNPRRRRRQVLAALTVVLFATAFLVLRNAGAWLVVEDALQPSRAVVVLGGQVPFRAMEAAAVFNTGSVKDVWVTQAVLSDEDIELARLGVERPTEYHYSVEVLGRLGVPPAAIHVVERPVLNTAEELRAIAQELQDKGGDRVVLVTSKYHARRVRQLWHALVGDHPAAIVRYARGDPFEPDRWWRTTGDAMAVSREWLGILNAWLGFPVSSSRS